MNKDKIIEDLKNNLGYHKGTFKITPYFRYFSNFCR